MITLGIVTMTPALCRTAIKYARDNTRGELQVIVYANACDCSDVGADLVISSEVNTGVVPGIQALIEACTTDLFAFIHDDLELYEPGWDKRVTKRFAESPACDLVGFGGALTLGRPDMYTCGSPFEPTRGPFRSNLTAMRKEQTPAEAHGPRTTADFQGVIFDGFAFVARRTFLEEIGRMSWWPLMHHGYDYGLSCMVARHKKELWIVPLKMGHPWIGGTSQRPDALASLAKGGGNYGMYHKSNALIREMFRDVLPLAMPGAKHTWTPTEAIPGIFDGYFGAAAPMPSLPVKPELEELKARLSRPWLDRLQACIESAISADTPGDIVCDSPLARAVLKAHGIEGRQVWASDGAPFVEAGLLDDQVSVAKGAALTTAPILAVSVLATENEATLRSLYPRVAKRGFVIVGYPSSAVDAYRVAHKIDEPIVRIDGSSAYWQKERTWYAPRHGVTLVIPTLTEAGAERTRALIDAAMRGSCPPENIFVIDNGGYFRWIGVPTVWKPGKNVGVAAAWNEALRRYGDWCIFANDDAEIGPETIADFVTTAEVRPEWLITCDVGQGFPFFLLKRAAIDKIGLFDERFLAYYEDTDYLHRLAQVGQKPFRIGGVKHSEAGGTSSREAGFDVNTLRRESLAKYVAKWGGEPGRERAKPPVVSVGQQNCPPQNRFRR